MGVVRDTGWAGKIRAACWVKRGAQKDGEGWADAAPVFEVQVCERLDAEVSYKRVEHGSLRGEGIKKREGRVERGACGA